MKRCYVCLETKSPSEFPRRTNGKLNNRCRSCFRSYLRGHYVANKADYLGRAAASRDVVREIVLKAKSQPCADCGQRYPYYVMDFDHLGDDKRFNISTARFRESRAAIEEEIEKCEVVCANCHRSRTHRRRELKEQIARTQEAIRPAPRAPAAPSTLDLFEELAQ